MATNLRWITTGLLGAALFAMPTMAAAAQHGGGGGHGGGGAHGGGGGHVGGGGEGFRSESGVRAGGGEFRGGTGDGFRSGAGMINRPQASWNRGWTGAHSEWNRNWAGDRGRDWDDWGRRGWWGGGWGLGYPWGWGLGYGGWWGPGYGYGSWWPGSYGYGYDYPYYGGYAYDSGSAPYTAAYASTDSNIAASNGDPQEESRFFDEALTAFRQGDYRNAMRMASHAAVDNPQDPSAHVLLYLSMFAQNNYRGAAMEAHGLAAMGKIPDWNMVYGFYGDVQPFETQLRALEAYVGKNPSSAEARFLLGFQYMMEGHNDVAKNEFLDALRAAPQDRIAAELLKHTGGTVPVDIAQRLSEQPSHAPQGTPGQGTPSSPPSLPPSPVRK